MGQPAARLTDLHVCPKVDPGPTPHVGGPILSGWPTVLIGKLAAARQTDQVFCVPGAAQIMKGSTTVRIGKQPAARIGDPTQHGGTIVKGWPTVLIGG